MIERAGVAAPFNFKHELGMIHHLAIRGVEFV